MYSWGGNILYIDLTREKTIIQPLPEDEAFLYLGGRGLNSYRLYKMVSRRINPLGPDNPLLLSNGVLSGTTLPMTSRTEITSLSPLTGILGDGSAGGSFAAYLKYAGYDQIVVTGRASSPTYVWIEDKNVELRSASSLWGMTFGETVDTLRDIHGDDISVAGIGPAGENLVRFATTMIDKYHSGARGTGAVWGSKNLKAIAVRGTLGVNIADPEEFHRLAMMDLDWFKHNEFVKNVYSVIGTHYGLITWHPGWKHYTKYLGPEELPEGTRPVDFARYEIGRTQCFSCPIACKDVYWLPSWGEEGVSSEYESIYALGTNNGVTDTEAILKMEHMADEYGMDVITLGDTIALARLLYEKGLITGEDTGSIKLDWGDPEGQLELIEMIAYRKGFGDKLAEGYMNLANIIGGEALKYALHVKGLTRGWYSVDFLNGLFTLAHATSTRGADHLRGRSWAYLENDRYMDPRLPGKILSAGLPDYREDPVGALIYSERACVLADSVGRCKGSINSWVQAVPLVWKYPIFEGLAKLLRAATGKPFTEDKLIDIADRIYLVEMSFNVKQGIKKKHYNIPHPPGSLTRGQVERHWRMVEEYLERRGCDPGTGKPGREKLRELGVEWIADEIEHTDFPEWNGPPLHTITEEQNG